MKVASAAQTTEVAPSDDELARLAVLQDYVDVTAPPPEELQAVVRLAARVTGNPNAVVNIIDEHLQRQLAAEGFERADCAREDSMCHFSLGHGGLVHAADARRDIRFAAHPWVDGRLGTIRSYAAAPLLTPDGLALGTLCVFGSEPRELSADQQGDLSDLAELVVSIFDRERRARRQRADEEALHLAQRSAETARALQSALLPRRLPNSESVHLTSRYRPGTDGAEVGGDFYDAFRTDRAFVVVMGDVQGHNSHAAALMGQVRTAVSAYVSEGHEPAAVLARTNELMQGLESDLFATCCLLSLVEHTGELTIASAGHPAPLLFAPGPVRSLDVDPGPPLGVAADALFPETRHHLDVRSRLLLYTDGVVEWTRAAAAVGVRILEKTLAETAQQPGDVVAERVLAAAGRSMTDDAALLVLDYAGPATGSREVRLQLPADARAVGTARKYLRATLQDWNLTGAADLAELVVSELVTNALLHTGSSAALTLRHDLGGSSVSVGVEDSSTQHPQPREVDEEATGGRGMTIVQMVCDRWWVTARGDGKTVWAELTIG
ncbi:MAG: ATP-binding SpoIIE family protein phosphatase [Janthinobacterium lividum]